MSETVAARRPIAWSRDRTALAALLAGLVLLPWVVAGRVSLSIFLFIGLNALIAIGLTLLGGYAGQVSLGQAAFYGVGAYVSAITTLRYGVDPWLGMACAVAGAALLAWVVGAPVLILRGHYLVLGTLALNVVVDVLFRNLQPLTGGPSGLTGIPPLALGPVVLAGDRALYYLSWAAVLGALALSRNLVRSRVGRALAAVRGSEVVAATLAVNPASYKGRVFALSAAFAGLAGSLYVHWLSFVNPTPFAFEFSIALLVMSVLGGIAHLPGAVLGAAVLTILREALRTVLPRFFRAGASAEYEIIVFGVLLAAVVIFWPQGLWPFVLRLLRLERVTAGAAGPAGDVTAPSDLAATPGAAAPSVLTEERGEVAVVHPGDAASRSRARGGDDPLIAVEHLTKRFGGLLAVDDVTFAVPPGEIYAIIGPNGAGKTTVFNLISGVLRPTAGRIALDGLRLDRLPAYAVAAAGVARTFQTPHIVPDLTVAENVMLGLHRHLHSGFVVSMLGLAAAEEAAAYRQSLACLERVGLAHLAGARAGALPFGAQRLVELARALAAQPRLLLLDEPASGLSAAERAALVALIRRIRADGATVLLVEHDVGLVMGLADRVLVLNYGRAIAEGPPQAVQQDPQVIAAYLGEPAPAGAGGGKPS
ncbi:MAG: branched-chain amino acid ABC transporter ATP-binding protein/permease [Armatimonadota bacterium]|nr:branched-chain amino acid ABC transporter ATP-binding protein/permease [Armatimonadota bacterium]MDR7448821.1 branched-chain amino acid ABC transporter ATP-binding protein/permease [Armatimonadota bacterium]MDR7459942.1 branched-chain amino acid ABC transporter ATP-binding protein/permease [Armatimonadota bacterium]MDR7479609.1 branched-chain amino acid ABC transporter ATP-binding protein/permease [Armatimonadota bacterium]MDR7488570.1 branched-chain amino acid ABC transporter ATP-binding pr